VRGPLAAVLQWWKDGNGNGAHNGTRVGETPHLRERPSREASHEPPWLGQLDGAGIPRSLNYPDTTLGQILDQAAERFGDGPALRYQQRQWTYRELLGWVNRTAGGLARHGVRAGDRVLLALPNCPEYVFTFFALQKLGALVVNAGPLLGADDLRHLVSLTTPRAVIGLDVQASKVIGAAQECGADRFIWVTLQSYQTLVRRLGYQLALWRGRESQRSAAHHTTLAQLWAHAPAKPPTVEPAADAAAVLQPTSGTTGALKLAQLSHRNLLANATQFAVWLGARTGQERVLALLPLFHVYGLMAGLITPVSCAATITLMTRFDAGEALDILLRERSTVFPMVPAVCEKLNREIERRSSPLARLAVRCLSGAAPLPIEVADRFEQLTGARVVEGYGLSEASPVTHANLLAQPRFGSIGLPMPDTACRIVDLETGQQDVPPGKPGELLVSGPQIMAGYFGDPAATRQALATDEAGRIWFRTGDIARMDADGFFQILDRKKDMINHAGLKVFPGKVEQILRTHPRVADAAVIGRPDPVHTEIVVAIVASHASAQGDAALADELAALCREHLAPYEVPARFEFVEQIPRSVLGKALKRELRAVAQPSTEELVPARQAA